MFKPRTSKFVCVQTDKCAIKYLILMFLPWECVTLRVTVMLSLKHIILNVINCVLNLKLESSKLDHQEQKHTERKKRPKKQEITGWSSTHSTIQTDQSEMSLQGRCYQSNQSQLSNVKRLLPENNNLCHLCHLVFWNLPFYSCILQCSDLESCLYSHRLYCRGDVIHTRYGGGSPPRQTSQSHSHLRTNWRF